MIEWRLPCSYLTVCTVSWLTVLASFSSRNPARCVSTNWTGSSSTQKSSPSPSSFILGSGLLSSATPETLSKHTQTHTRINVDHTSQCRSFPSACLLCIASLVPSVLIHQRSPRTLRRQNISCCTPKEDDACQRGRGVVESTRGAGEEKTSGVTFSHASSRVPGFRCAPPPWDLLRVFFFFTLSESQCHTHTQTPRGCSREYCTVLLHN